MKCDLSKEKLMAFLYDELNGDERADFERHLSQCPACRKEIALLESSRKLLQAWQDEEPPAFTFVQDKYSVPESLRRLWSGFSPLRKILWGLATGAVAALLFLSLLQVDATYKAGEWHIRLGLWKNSMQGENASRQTLVAQPVSREEFEAWKTGSVQLFADMLEASQQKQKQELSNAMLQLAQRFELQRRQDLQFVGRGLEVLQNDNESKYRQTSQVLEQLLQVASYQGGPQFKNPQR